jgi:all-trans-retinol 13,14-reductase
MDFDAIIIGGGLGGLSAGAFLSRHGKRVMLIEQHYIPGGCATTFKRKNFLMEVGLHALDGSLVDERKSHSMLRFLGVKKDLEFQTLPEFFQMQNAHMNFTFPNGTDQAVKALVQAFPGEERGIRKLFKLILGVDEELSRFPKKIWEKVLKFPLFPLFFPNITLTFSRTLGSYLDKNFKSEELKLILQGNLLYYHDDPYSMSLVFFAKAQSSFINKGGYFIKGGSQNLSDSLARVITENQGFLLLGKKVNQILVEEGKAVGVSFSDAFNTQLKPEVFRANHIIHSGALPLLADLMEGAAAKKIKKKIKGMIPSCSLFCVYIGFSREVKSLGHNRYSTFIYGDDVKSLKDIHANYHGPWEQRSFAFVDYGQVDSGLAPEGKSFGVICSADKLSTWEELDDTEYQKKKDEAAWILINRLENTIPGITELIETYEIGTSRTIKRYTLNPSASPYGFAQTPAQAGFKRPFYRSPVKNLWLSGIWTFPGGGFTGAIVSGFLCGLKVKKQLKKRPQIKKEGRYSDQREVKLLQKMNLSTATLELTFQKPPEFNFEPGQYAFVSLSNPTYKTLDMPLRPLSIVSHPSEDHLRFVMRSSSSSFKKSCEALQAGDLATIYGPIGEFTLKPKSTGVVFLVSGIGISPVLPMLRELEQQEYAKPVYLFYSNKTEDSATYHQQLKNSGIKNYTYVPVFTGSEERIHINTLKKTVGDLPDLDFYIVGSSGFLNSMLEMLEKNRVPAEHIFTDDFG